MTVVTSDQKATHSNAASRYDALAFSRETLAHWQSLAVLFDHTLLKPEATREQVIRLCEETATYRFACAMINPTWTSLAVSLLSGTGIPVGAVVGFPLGASLSTTKRAETEALVTLGAKEIDMVINIGALKSGDHARVSEDIRGVVEIAHDAGAIVKVILETCLLTVQEKLLASELALQAGTDFLKTSTGFSSGGATSDDVAILRGVAGTLCGVKASGGIKTLDHVRAVLEAGANRIGASASVAIVREIGAP
jgi:deoxyribose-phosphate aldolase